MPLRYKVSLQRRNHLGALLQSAYLRLPLESPIILISSEPRLHFISGLALELCPNSVERIQEHVRTSTHSDILMSTNHQAKRVLGA